MICPHCGNQNPEGSNFCMKCAKAVNQPAARTDAQQAGGLRCKKCGSTNVVVQVVTDIKTKHRGCIGWALWILLAICTFGLILIIPLLTNSKTKSKNHSEAVCQNCGNRWRTK